MAKDFPEDKYDFKVQKDQRTFALNLLHAAALDFVLIRRVSGTSVGPDFGEGDNPSRDAFKTKADVVKFVEEAVADGAKAAVGQARDPAAAFSIEISGPNVAGQSTGNQTSGRDRPGRSERCDTRLRRRRSDDPICIRPGRSIHR